MEIRLLGPGDVALLDAAVRTFHGFEHRGDPSCLADPGALAFVAVEGETVVGWAFGHELPHPAGPATLALYEMEISPAARGGGIGRALLDAFAEAAHARGFGSMWMMTDVEGDVAHRLYANAGSRSDGRTGSWWIFA